MFVWGGRLKRVLAFVGGGLPPGPESVQADPRFARLGTIGRVDSPSRYVRHGRGETSADPVQRTPDVCVSVPELDRTPYPCSRVPDNLSRLARCAP